MEELCADRDSETSSKANCFLRSVTASDFLISLCSLSVLFTYTLPLCKILQSPSCDLVSPLEHVELISNRFQKIREDVILEFNIIFQTAQELSSVAEEKIKIPRVVARQQHRSNISTTDPETYFRITILIPLLDDFISQLKMRFENHKSTLSSLYVLIPSTIGKNDTNFNEENFQLYKKFLDWDTMEAEFLLWKTKCHQQLPEDRAKNAIEALQRCNQQLFPNIHKLLKMLATLPVSTCTPERTFSTMKRLKTYLRNSTGNERLTGLALMSIHIEKLISILKRL